jgi:hypothetical protein
MFGFPLDNEQTFDNHRSVARTRVRRRRLASLLCATTMVIALVAQGAQALGTPEQAVRERRYVVQPGDSLWSIAVETGRGRDPRVVVEEIARASGLRDRVLLPGQLLIVPGRG